MQLKVGDTYKCPDGHKARIVWINEDKKVMAIKCPQKHLSKVVKVSDRTRSTSRRRNHPEKEKKIYAENMVFLIKIQ